MKFGSWLRRARRWQSYPKLLVPITKGPLLGYYHFLTGYFLPVYWSMLQEQQRQFVMISCGPMDKWFSLLPRQPQKVIDPVEGLQTAFRAVGSRFARGYVVETFRDWDLYRNFSQRPLSEVSEHIRGRFAPPHEPKPGDKPKAVVLIRDHVPDALTRHPTREFGPAKRNIPNLKAVAKSLEKHFSVELLDGSAQTPEETVAACSNADLLIGQHGAGLANALFLPPGAHVIEIGWNPVESNPLGHFEALSAELGLGWKYLALQEDQFAPISAEELERELLPYVDPLS